MNTITDEDIEDEVQDLRDKNCALAKEVQSLKMMCAQKDKEKLELTKENNELRLKISRIRSTGTALAHKLDCGLQASSEDALSYLVQASGAVAKMIELKKIYIQELQEIDQTSPKWRHISSGSPGGKKINEVPPLLMGGQSIQPVVSLSRTMLNDRSINRSQNQNSGVTHRAYPIHMLQELVVPLTRIDAAELQAHSFEAEDSTAEQNNSAEDLGLEESDEQPDVEQSEDSLSFSSLMPTLDAVIEESIEEEVANSHRQSVPENPLEGPSWLYRDVANPRNPSRGLQLEPDSTTPFDTPVREAPPATSATDDDAEQEAGPVPSLAFSPTVRHRRKRPSTPPAPTFSPPRQKKQSTRVLKVVIAKMPLPAGDTGGAVNATPPSRSADLATPEVSPRRSTIEERPRFDAPSPNGSTDAGVIVCESHAQSAAASPPRRRRMSRRDSRSASRVSSRDNSRSDARSESDGDHTDTDTRTRRARKQVSYKEKPLNRKLRR